VKAKDFSAIVLFERGEDFAPASDGALAEGELCAASE
jgi:hypothetical protein